ncbi:glycosyltransferase [Zunongwangia profunda]|uniref:glycosyltransferase n=1 Tax=Zunongwangia profunda TaxID=398743 RepID=UPI000C969E2D|nr:glycosyltransferase [Zunongwangia profunda]MAG88460.1 glycosyl transferase family 1 [Flavobacteriaceae bacterium]|tara:strand:- start:966 stop:2132 length:1167 start_codon:yes stop_codon:yes gene_type:complete
MRILRVIATMKPESGGPCQGIRNSIPVLMELGIVNEVVCFDDADIDYSQDPFHIHAIGKAKGPYAYQPLLSSWLAENLGRFDVVIIHGLWLYNSYGTYRAWRKFQNKQLNSPKLYVMPHGMLDPYFQKAEGRRLKALRNLVFWKLIESKVINGVDGVLFTCEQELLLARQTFNPYCPQQELDVGYGVPAPPLYDDSTMKNGLEEQSLCIMPDNYILFLSRIHEKKGVDLLIKAYLKLHNKNVPDLVIAGPGLDTAFGIKMQRLASKSNHIHFTGMLTGDAKWGAFYGAEAFILPSHQENFGIAVAESLACSIPVIITKRVNIFKEIAKHNAGLVAENNEDSVFDQLKKWFLMSSSEKEVMKSNAFNCFQKEFTVQSHANRMISKISII